MGEGGLEREREADLGGGQGEAREIVIDLLSFMWGCPRPRGIVTEINANERYSGPAADVWSLGVIIATILTGGASSHLAITHLPPPAPVARRLAVALPIVRVFSVWYLRHKHPPLWNVTHRPRHRTPVPGLQSGGQA